MAGRTAWTAGNINGNLNYTTLLNSSDLVSLANGSSVLSSVATIANAPGANGGDMFMDVSMKLAMSGTGVPPNGSACILWIYNLNQDGVTFGDNQLGTSGSAGTQFGATPAFPPAAIFGVPSVSASTLFATVTGITIPPGSFRCALQTNIGTSLSAGTQTVQYRTYNINLNN